MEADQLSAVARDFIDAFSAADFEAMRELLAEDMVAGVTDASGATELVEGRERYLRRIAAMDLPSARFSVELTQPPVAVGSDLVLLMVEIHAERGGRALHNFAGHLLRIAGGRIAEWWMVDAKPAESDAFWSR
ncbi:MAG: nuclear transport factor 2 family protein [Solirubrobacterales bacterium]